MPALIRADLDIATEAAVFARLVDGLGLRSSLSGRWTAARRQLVHHLATLGVSERAAGADAGGLVSGRRVG